MIILYLQNIYRFLSFHHHSCPKCRNDTLINITQFHRIVAKELDTEPITRRIYIAVIGSFIQTEYHLSYLPHDSKRKKQLYSRIIFTRPFYTATFEKSKPAHRRGKSIHKYGLSNHLNTIHNTFARFLRTDASYIFKNFSQTMH